VFPAQPTTRAPTPASPIARLRRTSRRAVGGHPADAYGQADGGRYRAGGTTAAYRGAVPELPDVEGFRRVLASCAQGRRIRHVVVADPGVLREADPRRFRRALEGRRFGEPERLGKWLVAPTDGPVVLMHFGMTGQLVCCAQADPAHPHDRVVFVVDSGQLRFRDQRKLQGIRLAPDGVAVARILARQGPDALGADRVELEKRLAGRRARIKAVLMDQSVLAGLGNLTADEILWRTGVHPARPVSDLTSDDQERLHAQLRHVLRACVRVGRVPPRPAWLTGHRDDPDPVCPRCDARLTRGRIAGRTAVWCPRCQPS
jgi:formamidopyrimidine-DNA glycosylase